MKEIIGAVILVVGLYGGTKAIKEIHNTIMKSSPREGGKRTAATSQI